MKNIIILIIFSLFGANAIAQDSNSIGQEPSDSIRKVIQFSGVIAEGDSLYGIAGAVIISTESGAGTSSNLMGYFSMPVFEGDSVLIAALGYKKEYLIIPQDTSYSYSLIIKMKPDTIQLPEVDLSAFPTEEVFKEVLLAMDLNYQDDYTNMTNNINAKILKRINDNSPLVSSASYRYQMDRQAQAMQQKYMLTTNPLLNPFAWARLVKDVKSEIERKKKEKKEENNNSKY